MDPLYWAILLLVLSVALIALEMFVPSGGVIGALAVLAVLGAIGVATYYQGWTVGALFVVAALVLLPLSFAVALKFWPRTPLGRRILLEVHSGDEVLPDDDPRRRLPLLVGHVGRAKSAMLPSGAVEIDGHIYEAISEGMPIDASDAVRVTAVRHSRLVVRKA